MFKILVIAEINDSELTTSTLEVCQIADTLAVSQHGSWSILVPDSIVDIVGKIAPKVISFPLGENTYLRSEVLALTVAQAAESADVVMMAATSTGKDVIARLAQLLSVPLAQSCTGLEVVSGEIIFKRSLHGGKVIASVKLSGKPILASFRPRSFTPIARSEGFANVVTQIESNVIPKVGVRLQAKSGSEHPDVTDASIVVSGGRGLQGPQNWHILEDLRDALGPNATLACSRPVSDENWRPHSEHVGQTGRSIAPDLYVAVGISGATQHVAGIARSKCILAINKDPDAPIFQVADYGIVGDLFEVVPAFTAAIRNVA